MQFRTSLFIFFLSSAALADSIKFNTLNNSGVVGLINMPSARFFNEGSYGLTLYRGEPDRKITLTLMPYDWLEGSIFYTSITGKSYALYQQNYKDKGLNVKFRVKDEGNYPALAIGLNDIGGTGIYSSEYFVGSYGIGALDVTLGLGWGRYASDKIILDNPLQYISDSFLEREIDQENGGNLSIDNFFSGPGMSIFGGISYSPSEDFLVKAEYDPSQYPLEKGFQKRKNDYSLSLEYIKKYLSISFSFERGDYWGVKFNWKGNSIDYKPNTYKSRKLTGNNLEDLRYALYKNNIGVNRIEERNGKLKLELYESSYHTLQKLKENIQQAVLDSNIYHEEIVLKLSSAGLDGYENGTLTNGAVIYERKNERIFNYKPSIIIRPFIASREGFLKAALISQVDAQYLLSNNFFWSTNIKYTLYDNFNDLSIPPEDTYPNQVRSDIKDYLNNFGGRPIIGRSQLDYFKTLSEDHHIQLTFGILEEMFAGYGFEYLWSNPNKNFSMGIELFQVFKRDYELRLGLKDYQNVSGHLNLYFNNTRFLPFDFHLSIGEYLAGDKGYTFDISRKFSNGVKMGGFFTRTDVSALQFGEGSFDKGIYFSIPLRGDLFSFAWRPLTKDPGSKLLRKDNLHEILRKYKY